MGYWTKQAANLKDVSDHPWYGIYEDALEQAAPEKYAELQAAGELEGYIAVKVAAAIADFEDSLEEGIDEPTAREMALADLMPTDEDLEETEDYEIEGGIADAAAGLTEYLNRTVESDPTESEAVRMALQPGTRKNVNGQEYILNRNHRWTRPEDMKAQQSQAKQQQTAPRPAPKQSQASQGSGKDYQPGPQPKPPVPTNRKNPRQPKGAQPPKQGKLPVLNVDVDKRGPTGVTEAARVGVPAMMIPPPPPIPRIPRLTPRARAAESRFAGYYEADPDGVAEKYLKHVIGKTEAGEPPTFETDGAKDLSGDWNSESLTKNLEQRAKNRATLNVALHQTANAITKRAFLKHLDTLPPGSQVLVTLGGCGAGKGYALGRDKKTGQPFVPDAYAMKQNAAVVWDSAGDQNATENPWIHQEAKNRGLKVAYVFVHTDPYKQWDMEGRGVIHRATDPDNGRMIDAKVYADSYAIGAKNSQAHFNATKDDPDTSWAFIQNGSPPTQLDSFPQAALSIDRHHLNEEAVKKTHALKSRIPKHVIDGALIGQQIWEN